MADSLTINGRTYREPRAPPKMTQVERIAALTEIADALAKLGMHEPAGKLRTVVAGLSWGPDTYEEALRFARKTVADQVANTERTPVGRTHQSLLLTRAMGQAVREAVENANPARPMFERRGRGYDVGYPGNGYRTEYLRTGTSAFRVWCPFCRDWTLLADVETHVAGYHGETELAVAPAPAEAGVRPRGRGF